MFRAGCVSSSRWLRRERKPALFNSESLAPLEARLQIRAKAVGVDVGRLRKQVAFDCFLTRIFPSGSDEAGCVLKGGYALELRFLHARTCDQGH